MASVRKIEGKTGTTYKITVSEGRDNDGKQIRHYKTWRPPQDMTARQISKELKKIAYEFEQDILSGYRVDDKQTFAEYSDYFLNIREKQGYKPGTLARYRNKLKRINKAIGHIKLAELRPKHLNQFYDSLSQPGANMRDGKAFLKVDFRKIVNGESYAAFAKKCGVGRTVITNLCNGRRCSAASARKIEKALQKKGLFEIQEKTDPLDRRTVLDYHAVINSILAYAEKEMILMHNPAQHAVIPFAKKEYKNKTLQPDELYAFLDALKEEPLQYRVFFTMLALTGCRRGEMLALQWDKVDFKSRTIKIDASLGYTPGFGFVEGTTKTGNIRFVALPEEAARLLAEHKQAQAIMKMKMGNLWKDSGHVFTNAHGGLIAPTLVNQTLNRICDRHGLPHITPHMFRHTAASIMITSGIDVLTVSKMLGHASTSITLDIYGHAIEEAKREATECIANNILRKKKA